MRRARVCLSDLRFHVALSFPGEHREYVGRVAECLANSHGRQRVFYDEYYEAELARPNLDVFLQQVYHDESALLVAFLCEDYGHKEWCGIEWRALRDIIKSKRDHQVVLVRMDDGEVPGIFSIDGYVDARAMPPEHLADLISKRVAQILPLPSGCIMKKRAYNSAYKRVTLLCATGLFLAVLFIHYSEVFKNGSTISPTVESGSTVAADRSAIASGGSIAVSAGSGDVSISTDPSSKRLEHILEAGLPESDHPVVDLSEPIDEQLQLFAEDKVKVVADWNDKGEPATVDRVHFGKRWETFEPTREYTVVGVPGNPITPRIHGHGYLKLQVQYTGNREFPRDLRNPSTRTINQLWIYRNVPLNDKNDNRSRSERLYEPFFFFPAEATIDISVSTQSRIGVMSHDEDTCVEITFRLSGDKSDWKGVSFVPSGSNPGRVPGINVSRELRLRPGQLVFLKFRVLTTERGGARVRFQCGGLHVGKYTDGIRFGRQPKSRNTIVTDAWTEVSIDLSKGAVEGLNSVINALSLIVRSEDNPGVQELTVFLDDIRFETENPPMSKTSNKKR